MGRKSKFRGFLENGSKFEVLSSFLNICRITRLETFVEVSRFFEHLLNNSLNICRITRIEIFVDFEKCVATNNGNTINISNREHQQRNFTK